MSYVICSTKSINNGACIRTVKYGVFLRTHKNIFKCKLLKEFRTVKECYNFIIREKGNSG